MGERRLRVRAKDEDSNGIKAGLQGGRKGVGRSGGLALNSFSSPTNGAGGCLHKSVWQQRVTETGKG
jgi:hypothetical protein